MQTYYIRHSSKLDLDEITMQKLWDEDWIAIHYPSFKSDEGIDIDVPDNDSLEITDYQGKGLTAMKYMHELSTYGGYVFADYRNKDCKVGYVAPNAQVKVHYGTWGEQWDHSGRTAAIKYLKLDKVKVLSPADSLPFKAIHPRKGTFVHWNIIGSRVKALVEGLDLKKSIDLLSPDQQEVMCAEFLRSDLALQFGLPQIESMQLPIGRTLKDVDIIGNTKEGKTVVVQVTYTQEKWKTDALQKYADVDNTIAIMMSSQTTDIVESNNKIKFVQLEEVFDAWTQSEAGKRWLNKLN